MDLSETKHLPKVDHTPAELDEPSRLLLKAANVIESRGLPSCLGGLDHDGRGCVLVTIGMLSTDFMTMDEAANRVRQSIGGGFVHLWSDKAGREGRTHEVVSRLRAVALGL